MFPIAFLRLLINWGEKIFLKISSNYLLFKDGENLNKKEAETLHWIYEIL